VLYSSATAAKTNANSGAIWQSLLTFRHDCIKFHGLFSNDP